MSVVMVMGTVGQRGDVVFDGYNGWEGESLVRGRFLVIRRNG